MDERSRSAIAGAETTTPNAQTTPRPANLAWPVRWGFSLVVFLVLPGCQGRSWLTGGPTIGQLKTSLSHIEYENGELEKRVAALERDNRALEDRLVQEQLENGKLTARLDDARNLLRDHGVEFDTRTASRSGDEDEPVAEAKNAPERSAVSRSRRRRRKAPVARIPAGDPADRDSASTTEDPTDSGSAWLDLPRDRGTHVNPNRWARSEPDDSTVIIK